jgi:hypothetical protein
LIVGAGSANTDLSLFGLWPSREQDLVLRAALLDGDAAVSAFREWVGRIDLAGDFDLATFRLLPLLYDNLRRQGIRHPLLGRLKGAYRLAWYKNHKLFDDMRPVMATLTQAGIRTMLLKGAPLVLNTYRSHALRPMSDIDVLVPTGQVARAIEVLSGVGWRPYSPTSSDFFRYRHALCLVDAEEREFDLHWHCLFELSGPGDDDFLWSSARPFDFNGIPTLAPDPTRHLIVTILHGLRWNPAPPIRWIPDAIAILRNHADEVAWDELVGFAKDRRFSYRLHLGLSYLRQRFDAPIPAAVLAELQRAGVSILERIENTVVLRDLRSLYPRPVASWWIMLAEYCRYAWGASPLAFVVGFSHYLRYRWKLRGRLEIPGVVLRGVLKRLRGRVEKPQVSTGEEHDMALVSSISRPSGDQPGGF